MKDERTHSVLDDFLVLQVGLVANEELVDALARVAVDLLQPLLDVAESVLVRHVVDNDDAMRAAVFVFLSRDVGRRREDDAQ